MKTLHTRNQFFALGLITIILFSSGCGSSKKLTDYHKKGAELRYQYPVGKELHYSTHSDMVQSIVVNEQNIQTDLIQKMNFQVRSEAHPNSNILLNVVLDSFKLQIQSTQGIMDPDLSHIQGRHFNMLISETGKGLDVEGARSIEFEITPGAKRNVEMLFTFLFPRLPEKKVRIGESWILTDTIVEAYEGEELKMILSNQSTFETVESINGVACAKILTSISGVRNGSSQTQGMTMSTMGSVTGSGTFYVALDEGYIVKDESKVLVDGTLTVKGPQVQTFPMQLSIKTTTEWIR